jgi:hypothetical protein
MNRRTEALLSASASRIAQARKRIDELCAGEANPATLPAVKRQLELIDAEHEIDDKLLEADQP